MVVRTMRRFMSGRRQPASGTRQEEATRKGIEDGRRFLLSAAAGVLLSPVLAACGEWPEKEEGPVAGEQGLREGEANHKKGRLSARPQGQGQRVSGGRQRLGLGEEREALLYVPAGYTAERPAPLALMLHGAGGDAGHGMSLLESFAEEFGFVLLAPSSRRQTWDLIVGSVGPDVSLIDRALAETFSRCRIDPKRIAVGGFSDGASYALSLGIANGDLFTHVIAFSPGFMAPPVTYGAPRLFISHGTGDRVLPIDVCSRRIVPQARRSGYDVTYREFKGPHTVPPDIASEAVEWFVRGLPAASGA
jgi:phospholipase/carboxylesterase